MSGALNFLLSGGPVRRTLAVPVHSLIWSRRLFGGRSDVPEMRLLDLMEMQGCVAVDVGAHSGNWTVNLAGRVGAGGTVVAYEALPHYGRSLAMSLRLLRIKNAQVRTVAVGDSLRKMSLRWRSDDNQLLTGRTHIDPAAETSPGVVEIQMVPLDDDLRALGIDFHNVAFMKIDVEGAELEVLKGASNLLSIGRPAVYLETEPEWIERMGHSVEDVFKHMAGFGYDPHLVSESGPVPTTADEYLRQYASTRQYNNVLFLASK